MVDGTARQPPEPGRKKAVWANCTSKLRLRLKAEFPRAQSGLCFHRKWRERKQGRNEFRNAVWILLNLLRIAKTFHHHQAFYLNEIYEKKKILAAKSSPAISNLLNTSLSWTTSMYNLVSSTHVESSLRKGGTLAQTLCTSTSTYYSIHEKFNQKKVIFFWKNTFF